MEFQGSVAIRSVTVVASSCKKLPNRKPISPPLVTRYLITIKSCPEPMLTFLWNICKNTICEITQLRAINAEACRLDKMGVVFQTTSLIAWRLFKENVFTRIQILLIVHLIYRQLMVQVMACSLFNAKPLPKSMMTGFMCQNVLRLIRI